MSRQDKLIILYVALFCAGLITISFFWNANKFYTNAYTPMVQKSIDNKKIIEENRKMRDKTSDEPRAAGFRERDIEKKRGNGFSTF